MTPEARVKVALKTFLGESSHLYSHWPVMNGMGAPELDCNIVYNGYAISIECKAPGEKFTARQKLTVADKRVAGCIVLGYRGKTDNDDVDKVLAALATSNWEEAYVFSIRQTKEKGFM